ncbi:MAG: hypothetical protein EBW68_00860 [Actinobacteria bacterium]|nr:hypothetical protein [Actinomycetota bacterium]
MPISEVNFTNGIQAVSIENLDADANSVLYSSTGTDIQGDSAILKFEENIKKLTVSGSMNYVSAYPIAVEAGFNDNTFCTGVMAQNSNATDGSSVSILLSNNLGTDNNYYAGMTMMSSNSAPQYNQFASIPNALSINSQSSSVVLSAWNGQQDGTSAQNDNIMLCYNGAQNAHIINHNGQLVVGANNASFSGSTYGGDDGGTDKVLTSNGTNGLKWTTPAPAGITGLYGNAGYINHNVNMSGAPTRIQESQQVSLTTSGRYIIQYNITFQPSSASHQFLFTLARASVSGATGGASTNLSNGALISAGITTLGSQTSACHTGSGTQIWSSTAFVIDVPSASGTYYYTLWGQSDESSVVIPVNGAITVAKI